MRDGRFVTGLRYFTRDAGPELRPKPLPPPAATSEVTDVPAANLPRRHRRCRARIANQVQVAAWSDTSAVSEAARQTLREAAGIAIPEAGFVFRVLVVYLLVLVPVNWIVFRVLGRVEWAWLAAPVIADRRRGGRRAVGPAGHRLCPQPDGDCRAGDAGRLSVGAPDSLHGRVHVAVDRLRLPLRRRFRVGHALSASRALCTGAARVRCTTCVSAAISRSRLSGFQVASNSTGLVHSEQMQDLGGSRATGGTRTRRVGRSRTARNCRCRMPACCTRRPRASWSWPGSEVSNRRQAAKLKFPAASSPPTLTWPTPPRKRRQTLRRLLDLACRDASLRAGDVRLVAWTSQSLPGLAIRPQASQESLRTLVLVHLRRHAPPPPRGDRNLKADIADELLQPAAEDRPDE